MSMLAERKRKTKYSLNPRGNQWAQDSNKFGQKMLEKMGWKHGKGLGAKEDGVTEHVKVSYKNDSKGMGYKGNDEQWTEHEDKFAALLSSLSGEVDSKPVSVSSLEKKSQSSRARVHYKKFTQGKDLSRYSEKDLASIFGKKSLKDKKEANTEEPEEKSSELANEYLINSGSMTDYFKRKVPNFNKTAVKSGSESESEVSHSFGFGFKSETVAKQEKSTFVSYVSENKRKAEEEASTPKKKVKKETNQEQLLGVSNPAFNPLSTPIKLERHVLETIEESVNEEILEVSAEICDEVNTENSLSQISKKKRKNKNKDSNFENVSYSEEDTSKYSGELNTNVSDVLDNTVQQLNENPFEVKRNKLKSKDKSQVEKNPFEVKVKKKQLPKYAVENSQFHDIEESNSRDYTENMEDNPYEVKTKKKKSKYAVENPSFDPNINIDDNFGEVKENPYELNVKTKKKKNKGLVNCEFDLSIESSMAGEIQENPYEVKIKKKKAKLTIKNSSFDMNTDSVTDNGIDNCTFHSSIEPTMAEEIQENPYEVKIKKKKAKLTIKNSSFDMNTDSVTDNGIDNCTFHSSIEPTVAEEIQENPYEVKIKKKKAKFAGKSSSFDMNIDSISENGIDNCTFDSSLDPNVAEGFQENPYEVKIKTKKAKFAIVNPSFDMNIDSVSANSMTAEVNPYEVKIKKKKNKNMSEDSFHTTQSSAVFDNPLEVELENKKSIPEVESLNCDTSNLSENLNSVKNPCGVEVKKKKKQKQTEGISNPALNLDSRSISNDIVEDEQLMLNVAVIPIPVKTESKSEKSISETPQSVKRRKSVRFSNVRQEVTIPNEDVSNGIDNQCFDKQKSMLDENMQFISKTIDRFEAEIENDLNEEKQLMIGEVGNPSGNHHKLPDGTVKLKFKDANLGMKTPIYHLDKTGARKSYKHLIKGDIVLHFKETNLHEIPGYAVKKETVV